MFSTHHSFAQYLGGDGDGFDRLSLGAQFLDGFTGVSIYQGGDGDGFSANLLPSQFLDGFTGANIYLGGDGDGFSANLLPTQFLDGFTGASIYLGGNGDGFDLGIIDQQPLNGNPTCEITALTAGTQSNVANGTYSQEVIVAYALPPATDSLVVNNQAFAIGTSPQTVVLTDLVADGLPVDVTAFFRADTACTLTEDSLFFAPMSDGVENQFNEVAAFSAYPNPFHQEVVISFKLRTSDYVTLEVYSLEGKRVASLFEDKALANQSYEVKFRAPSHADGMYFCQLKTHGQVLYQKLVVLP